ncbi:MAG: FadR family transcriptional regulator [Firmicutes bacterium]|nr:FadR family transcriptional regulator [Bacillota bacterium]
MLRRLRKDNLYERVAEEIKTYIINNNLNPGDRLPPERELAEILGVSRTSIREGIKLLQTFQLVRVRPKEGITVKRLELGPLIEQVSFRLLQDKPKFRELVEARRIIEMDILKLAVERATADDLAAMARSTERMKKKAKRLESYLDEELAFHEAILRAAKNQVLVGFRGVLSEFFKALPELDLDFGDRFELTLEEHLEIYQAICERDQARALRVMERHLARYGGILGRLPEAGGESVLLGGGSSKDIKA